MQLLLRVQLHNMLQVKHLNLPTFVSVQAQNMVPTQQSREYASTTQQLSSLQDSHDDPNPTNPSSSKSHTSHDPTCSSFPYHNSHSLETIPTTNDIPDHENTTSATSVPTVPSHNCFLLFRAHDRPLKLTEPLLTTLFSQLGPFLILH
jgi:hypothetical protein